MKKYELTGETKVINGVELHRIKAIESFGNINEGYLGGWIESEKNLSQYGDAWVGGNAMVSGNAWVGGNAIVCGKAIVRENAWVCGKAKVCGDARIGGYATVYGNATVRGYATVDGYATVGGHATVCGDAKVDGYATIDDNATVGEKEDYIVFKNWWSSGRYFTWTRSNNKWKVGCFYGNGEQLIKKAYEDSLKSGREYERVVKYVESILKEENNNGKYEIQNYLRD